MANPSAKQETTRGGKVARYCWRSGAAEAELVRNDIVKSALAEKPGEVNDDAEGITTMKNLGRNMAWLLKKVNS